MKLEQRKTERIKASDVRKEYLVSETTLWRWRKRGILTPVGRIGKKEFIYLRADVERVQAEMM